MIFDEKNHSLITFKGDYGVPVIFSAGKNEGFSVGDKIVFVFNTEIIKDKSFTVNTTDFSFPLKISKKETKALYTLKWNAIRYSCKRYSSTGEFLETILDGNLIVEDTLLWEGEGEGDGNG